MFIVGDAHRCQVMLIVWVGLGLEFAGEVLYKTILNCPGGHWNLGWGRVQCVLAQFFDLENFDRISYVWLEDLCRIMCLGMMLLTFQLDQSVSTEAAGKQGIYISQHDQNGGQLLNIILTRKYIPPSKKENLVWHHRKGVKRKPELWVIDKKILIIFSNFIETL